MIKNKFRIVFLETLAPQKKIEWITKMAQHHFDQKQSLHFYVDSQQGIEFIDKILWSTPTMSFLPHSTHNEGLVTVSDKLFDEMHHIFNLTGETLTPSSQTSIIYEFDDQTNDTKKTLSRKKYSHYKQNGFHIINQ